MIQAFRCKDTQALFEGKSPKRFRNIEPAATRRLQALEAAGDISELNSLPGNRLEKLKGNRDGLWSIRINDQWRVCFAWKADGAHEVEIVDYH